VKLTVKGKGGNGGGGSGPIPANFGTRVWMRSKERNGGVLHAASWWRRKVEGEKNLGSVAVDVSQRAVMWSSGEGVLAAATHGGEGGGGPVAGKMRGRRK
jgi:hypothetical protein